MTQDRPYRRERRRAALACLLLAVAYFLVPVEQDPNELRLVLRGAATAVLVALISWLVTGLVRRQLLVADDPGQVQLRPLVNLAVALVAGLFTFALADLVIARSAPGQFVNLTTRIDAIYFALATLTTVGYGDVHAEGQVARVAVSLQMVFSIGVVATGVSIVLKQLTRRPARR
ncbi:voltage-gated potassium channel [Micromonospora sp. MW-13]|uniref:potassium channel family protein n=1 Tax=Micromonospora sp. MW-13 TaxID=2094022 RepID=UPI000E44F30F|nr:potassium channel family protein [Micromonospora sp. MW-13]RGC70291.1 voltage-gated potassium channel [Micromonospora sp. MW-13]